MYFVGDVYCMSFSIIFWNYYIRTHICKTKKSIIVSTQKLTIFLVNYQVYMKNK